ncbi:hypothetical protein BH11BAC3_BH11BAC3_17070 [soil metagenome]
MINTDEKLFDLAFLEQMDDNGFIIQVIDLYLQDTAKDLDDMKIAFSAGELDTVYKTAHKLKSSTGMLQANTLFETLEKTEKLAKERGDANQVSNYVESAIKQFQQLRVQLELHLKVLQSAA